MNTDSKLSDYQDIGTFTTPAFEGSWMCSKVYEMKGRSGAYCMRFMPKEEVATMADPRFKSGEIEVITYLEGRNDEPIPSDAVKDGFASGKSTFEEFRLNLTMGAFQNMFVSAAALTATLTAFAF